jgi:hypothetical protein
MRTRYVLALVGAILAALALLILYAAVAQADHVYIVRPGDPISNDGEIDTDGRIPEYLTCGFRAMGRASSYRDAAGDIQFLIRYNICAARRQDWSVAEWRETIAHERAHARGFAHHESTPRRNPAYYARDR